MKLCQLAMSLSRRERGGGGREGEEEEKRGSEGRRWIPWKEGERKTRREGRKV